MTPPLNLLMISNIPVRRACVRACSRASINSNVPHERDPHGLSIVPCDELAQSQSPGQQRPHRTQGTKNSKGPAAVHRRVGLPGLARCVLTGALSHRPPNIADVHARYKWPTTHPPLEPSAHTSGVQNPSTRRPNAKIEAGQTMCCIK